MADVKCLGITGSCKEVSQFQPSKSIKQNKCAWLTVTVWENSSKQFKEPGTKRSKETSYLHWVNRSNFKIGIVIKCYLKWATGKEWKRTTLCLKTLFCQGCWRTNYS